MLGLSWYNVLTFYIIICTLILCSCMSVVPRALLPGKVGPELHIYGKGIPFGKREGTEVYRFYLAAPPLPEEERNKWLLVYAHGNGETVAQTTDQLDYLAVKTGCYVAAVEYPGYGYPPDNKMPSVTLCDQALETLILYADNTWGFSADNIILIGRSAGTGLMAHEAARNVSRARYGGLVLVSPFSSVQDIAASVTYDIAPFGLKTLGYAAVMFGTAFTTWRVEDDVLRFEGPVIVIHGEDDTVIPVEQGEAVARAAEKRAGRFVLFDRIPNCGHNEYILTDPVRLSEMLAYILPNMTLSYMDQKEHAEQLDVPGMLRQLWK